MCRDPPAEVVIIVRVPASRNMLTAANIEAAGGAKSVPVTLNGIMPADSMAKLDASTIRSVEPR